MQILMNSIHERKMSNSDRKMLSTMNAQMVMVGILKLHSHPRPSDKPAGAGLPESADFASIFMASNRSGGMAKATFGLRFFSESKGGSVMRAGGRPPVSYQAAMVKGSLRPLQISAGGQPSGRLM